MIMQILLIEPDIVLAKAYKTMLETQGHKVRIAQTGQAAIEAADTMPGIDCVLLEMQLPGLNGVAFLQELRSYHDFMRVPVIINSYMRPPHAAELQVVTETYGVVQWLYKPQLTLTKLGEAVARMEHVV